MGWAFGYATNTGAAHRDGKGQDACRCETFPYEGGVALVACVSDGAGSAPAGGVGARIACESFCREMRGALERRARIVNVSDPDVCGSFDAVVGAIQAEASQEGAPLSDYGCTLVGALVTGQGSLFLQVGDGAAAFRSGDAYEVAIWPEDGEFVNVTHFVTQSDAHDHVLVRRVRRRIDEIAIFSDGLQYLVLDFRERKAHEPFFRSLGERLEEGCEGYCAEVSHWLGGVLRSPQVVRRTDDDTALVVARRRNE
jgi:serine/threonine protein phosphatase PrpC